VYRWSRCIGDLGIILIRNHWFPFAFASLGINIEAIWKRGYRGYKGYKGYQGYKRSKRSEG
jgi:hypothetical protein